MKRYLLHPALVTLAALCANSPRAAPPVTLTPMEYVQLLLHLDEVGPPPVDTSGEEHILTVHGATPGREGRFGKAFGFDGVDDFVRVDDTFCCSYQTFELWVKPLPGKVAGGILSSQKRPGLSSWRWRLSRNADRTVSFHLYDNAQPDAPDREARSTREVPDNVWTHLAVTVDTADARRTVLYIDGAAAGEARVTGNSPFGSLYLGTATSEGYFQGLIDELRILDVCLPPETVRSHARAQEPFPDGAVLHSDRITLRPVRDKAWFTFRHPELPGSRWMLRMPEYMHYDEATKRNRTPYGVVWETNRECTKMAFHFARANADKKRLCLDFDGAVTAGKDSIEYQLRVTNAGDHPWERERMILFCMQCNGAPGFLDYMAERTFVRRDGQWVTMREVVKGTFADHRMCGVGVTATGEGKGTERIAARISKDGRFVIGIATDRASSLSFNFQDRIACLHSNPSWGKLSPGQEAVAKGRIYLFQGSLDDLWRRYRADFPETPK